MSARLSASILLVSPHKRVLMMKRPPNGSFPNVSVFPGGAMDESDPSLQFCALRELFEETGVSIDPRTRIATCSDRNSKYSHKEIALSPVSEWTTPALVAQKVGRIFKTQFFLYECQNEADLSSFVPNSEVSGLAWHSPQECLDKFKNGETLLFPPQFYLLNKLEQFGPAQVVGLLRDRVIQPKPIESSDDGVVMDWGEGEKGILTFKGKTMTNIRFKL